MVLLPNLQCIKAVLLKNFLTYKVKSINLLLVLKGEGEGEVLKLST